MKIKTGRGELPVRYSWNALRKIGNDLNLTMNEVLELDLMQRSIDDVFTFVLHGFKEGARFEKVDSKVSDVEDIADMLDDDPEILAKAMEAFKEDMKMSGEEDSKKK